MEQRILDMQSTARWCGIRQFKHNCFRRTNLWWSLTSGIFFRLATVSWTETFHACILELWFSSWSQSAESGMFTRSVDFRPWACWKLKATPSSWNSSNDICVNLRSKKWAFRSLEHPSKIRNFCKISSTMSTGTFDFEGRVVKSPHNSDSEWPSSLVDVGMASWKNWSSLSEARTHHWRNDSYPCVVVISCRQSLSAVCPWLC